MAHECKWQNGQGGAQGDVVVSGSVFERVVVIGYGVIARDVLTCVLNRRNEFGYEVEYIEHEVSPLNGAKRLAQERGVLFHTIEDKAMLGSYFEEVARVPTLVVSAGNNYLFPARLVSNANITIINFHNALLPLYPGRNAPSWAIYHNESFTGITWHYVNENVDDGEIIAQKVCPIGKDAKAYELVAALMSLGSQAFGELLPGVLQRNAAGQRQECRSRGRVFKSWDVPGDAHFELSDSPEYIYRLLRSLDYGKTSIFPAPTTRVGELSVRIKRYKLEHGERAYEDGHMLVVPYPGGQSLVMRYEIIGEEGKSSCSSSHSH